MSPVFTVENEFLKIAVARHGAQLESVWDKEMGYEYIWQGTPPYWRRKAPILFPIVGALKEKTYSYRHQTYTLSQHGFARDLPFDCLEHDETAVKMRLTSNEATKKNYPFDFSLEVCYRLEGRTLTVSHDVQNIGALDMYYGLGGHPGFNVTYPCDVVFEEMERLTTYKVNLENGLIATQRRRINEHRITSDGHLHFTLTPEVFEQDAIILDDIHSKTVTLNSGNAGHGVALTMEAAPYLGIWSDKGPFVCLEPWWGIADFEDTDQNIEHKKGMQCLEPNASKKHVYCLEFFK